MTATVEEYKAEVAEYTNDVEWFISNVTASTDRTELADNTAAAYRIANSVTRVRGAQAGRVYMARVQAANESRRRELAVTCAHIADRWRERSP